MSLVARGSIHQGHELFCEQSGGNNARLCVYRRSKLLKPVFQWTTGKLDSTS